MIYYLNNECKFHLYVNGTDVIYIEYENALKRPVCRSVRWMHKLPFNKEHMDSIENKLQSNDPSEVLEGKKMLEQTLKIKINGEIVGHYEGTPV